MAEVVYAQQISTGQRIVRLRKAAGMSVKDLQMIFGFSTLQAIYKWQQGGAMPAIDNLIVLSVVFGVAIDDIIVIEKMRVYKESLDGRDRKTCSGDGDYQKSRSVGMRAESTLLKYATYTLVAF